MTTSEPPPASFDPECETCEQRRLMCRIACAQHRSWEEQEWVDGPCRVAAGLEPLVHERLF